MNEELILAAQNVALTALHLALLDKGVDHQLIKEAIIDAKTMLHHDKAKNTQKEEVPAV